MQVRKGVSAIIYDKRGDYYFLILHRVNNWTGWEFPKGKIEEGENPQQALVREIKEETGLTKFTVKGRLTSKREFEHNGVLYSFDTYLVEANMNVTVEINKEEVEHDNYLWARRDSILTKLHWPEEKKIFRDALAVIESQQL